MRRRRPTLRCVCERIDVPRFCTRAQTQPSRLAGADFHPISVGILARSLRDTGSMREVNYSSSAEGVAEGELSDFFVGWPQPPSNAQRRQVLEAASEVVIARDASGTLVGFITAVTDGVFAAYIPLLEVLPDFQGQGIGRALVDRMLGRLQDCYMIDLVCDDSVVTFYEQLGGRRLNGVGWRNYQRQL